jgi:hypothetical protein
LTAVEGLDSPTVTVLVTRSRDSRMLVSETLEFEVKGGRVTAK